MQEIEVVVAFSVIERFLNLLAHVVDAPFVDCGIAGHGEFAENGVDAAFGVFVDANIGKRKRTEDESAEILLGWIALLTEKRGSSERRFVGIHFVGFLS